MQVAEATVASPVALAKVRTLSFDFSLVPAPLSAFAHLFSSSQQAADEARGLAIDSISKAHSGHMGLPLGCAEIGACLYGQLM